MNNPFKIGDKVVRLNYGQGNFAVGDVGEVIRVTGLRVALRGDTPEYVHHIENLRAAIAGQDYDVPASEPNTGHLPDGSSVQKHSAGLLYPCVLILRDKRLHGEGKYDVGVISPRNPEPIWCSSTDAAVAVAVAIKADLQGA